MVSLIIPSLIVIASGAIGGFINALMSDSSGIFLGNRDENTKIYKLGFTSNILLGVTAAFLTWSLYGSANSFVVWSSENISSGTNVDMSLSAVGGAILAGIGGAKVITNEIDKKFLRDAAVKTAAIVEPDDAIQIATAAPSKASELANKMLDAKRKRNT
jgi:hypothetical protein